MAEESGYAEQARALRTAARQAHSLTIEGPGWRGCRTALAIRDTCDQVAAVLPDRASATLNVWAGPTVKT